MTPPTWPVAPYTPTVSIYSPSSLKARCRATTAFSASSARTTQVSRMDEVEIISMLMPSWARTSNMVADTPGMGLHAGPDDRHGGDVGIGQ